MAEKQRDPGRMRQIRQTWEDYCMLLTKPVERIIENREGCDHVN